LLAGVAEGRSSGDLARESGLSMQTVKNCISEILHQLRVPNRTAAVTLALQESWIDLQGLHVRRTVLAEDPPLAPAAPVSPAAQ
jgi:hypothetical protein